MAMLTSTNGANGAWSPTPTFRRGNRVAKEEGDISSVFISLSGNKAEALPPRFAQLKREIIGGHGDALLASWMRLIPVVEAKVTESNERGPSIFPEVEFDDVKNNNVGASMIHRIKQTGVCIIRNAIPKNEVAQLLSDVRKYLKDNPTTRGT